MPNSTSICVRAELKKHLLRVPPRREGETRLQWEIKPRQGAHQASRWSFGVQHAGETQISTLTFAELARTLLSGAQFVIILSGDCLPSVMSATNFGCRSVSMLVFLKNLQQLTVTRMAKVAPAFPIDNTMRPRPHSERP
jgi:hypothetical protein